MFFSRFSLSDLVSYFLDLVSGRRSRAEFETSELRRNDCAPYLDFSQPLRILDLANGALRPQSIILASQGHQVVGVDLINSPDRTIQSVLYKYARLLFRLRFPKQKFLFRHPPLVCSRVEHLPFADNSFDLVTSIAAFEHFLDVEGTIGECFRVLKPGGIAWIAIHVFTTLTGGHNTGIRLIPASAPPQGYDAWDHLRSQHLPFTVPLNRLRISDYVNAFAKSFTILQSRGLGTEGIELLTPEIRSELAEYSEEELTCGSYLIQVIKVPTM